MKVVLMNIIVIFVGVICCLQIVPERAVLENVNEKYIENASVFITRYGRNSPYYFNIIGKNKHTWDNNVTVNLVFYEYLHNEYRRSFVELHFKLCDMLNSDPYVGAMVANAGITCPVYPASAQWADKKSKLSFLQRMQHMVNMSIPAADFKYLIPFKKTMAQLDFTLTASGESMGKANFYVTFIDKKKHV